MIVRREGKLYYLREDETDLACFPSFETAAIICRFVRAGRLEKEEYIRAIQAMKEFDQRGQEA